MKSSLRIRHGVRKVMPRFATLALAIASAAFAADTGPATLPASKATYQEVGASLSGASDVRATTAVAPSRLEFDAADATLVKAFDWAKRQSMAFVYEDDPVGPWYEAAEPGREAFCMRDTAHQAMGAHALGLARHNHNMLRRFAENISDARDWCSLWEIDRYNRPAPVDYRNDAEFWFNLPANFDVLDCCYRMYLWSGDLSYVNDPVFLNFYERTVTDYVERWALGPTEVMKRPRLLNVRGMPEPGKKFQVNRGIPGYDEQSHDYTLGVDVLACQYAAYVAYSQIQAVRGDAARADALQKQANAVKNLVNSTWWNEADRSFYNRLDAAHRPEGKAGSGLLYRGIVDDPARIAAALNDGRGSVEVLYRYGDADAAYARLIDIAFGGRSRREYPEVPFSWVGALVNGTMGIDLEATSAVQAWTQGFWVQAVIRTQAGLGTKVGWAELRNLPIRANEVTVRHDGLRKTSFTNQHGPALLWKATFAGKYDTLLVNGRAVKARQEKDSVGRDLSWVRVTVGGGGTSTVEAPAP
jgi:hypothetical protein